MKDADCRAALLAYDKEMLKQVGDGVGRFWNIRRPVLAWVCAQDWAQAPEMAEFKRVRDASPSAQVLRIWGRWLRVAIDKTKGDEPKGGN